MKALMVRFVLCTVLVVSASGPAAFAAPAAPESTRFDRVVAAIESERVRLKIPGVAFAIVEDDRVVLARGLGERDVARHLPVDTSTVFPIGSCTKSFTALAAVIEHERGKLSLDDSPKRYLPWFHMADPEAERMVTIRDMLSHRTGLRAYADLAAEPAVLTRTEFLQAAIAARPVAKPREKFQYSNPMITAVGEIVGQVEGTTWDGAIERLLFEPLGMRTSIANILDDLTRSPNHATGYADSSGTLVPTPPPPSLRAVAPAGSIGASAADMAKWLRFLLAEGAMDGRRVVSAAGLRDAITPLSQARGPVWYGLGWGVYDWNGHRVAEHTGGSQGLSAIVSFMPEKKLGFVILANRTPTSLTGITSPARMLYPLLTGETGEVTAPANAPAAELAKAAQAAKAAGADTTAAPDTTSLPALSAVLARITRAAGGEQNLRRHAAMTIRARKLYANHGVEAELTTRWAPPGRIVEEERWHAAGRSIATVRYWFDGAQGGQETTFGQTHAFAGDELRGVKRNAHLDWFLDPARAGLAPRVTSRARLRDEPVVWLEAKDESDATTRFAVSERTGHVVRKETPGSAEDYSDFRMVDGRVWPFKTVVTDGLGETDIVVEQVTFESAIPAAEFAPKLEP
jgi:CubicO group peptidase (beta-lactamase class C family)